MDAQRLLKQARADAGLSLRALAVRAGTSHSTLAAYEAGRKSPNVATVVRILRAAGFAADVRLERRQDPSTQLTRGEELASVLDLAAAFPARHANTLDAPVFGRFEP